MPPRPFPILRALRLSERRALLAELPAAGALEPAARAEAERLLEWWCRTYLGGRERLLVRRLAALGLNRETVLPLLAASGRDAPAPPPEPDWLRVLREVLARPHPRALGAGVEPGYAAALAPFLSWAADAWQARCARAEEWPAGLSVDVAALGEQLIAQLCRRLVAQASRSFTLRLHVARLSGTLRADSPEARFAEFVALELGDSERLAEFFARYPVLARVLATSTAQAVAAWGEMAARLAGDWALLGPALGTGPRTERLISVDASGSDRHRGGRTVMKLGFASGWRIIYKPRPLAVDAHVQALLAALDARGLEPKPRTLKTLDRGRYGWAEFIAAHGCADAAAVERFYRRQGALLLVFHLLEGGDLHMENVIAAGEHPMVVDLETMFFDPPRSSRRASAAEVRERAFGRLVACTGLLPSRIGGPLGSVELSALGGEGGQRTSFPVPRWSDQGTDAMRLELRQGEISAVQNLPVLDGSPVPVDAHEESVVAGFTHAYRLVMAHRAELGAPDGPLEAFRGDEVRAILRPTGRYAALLADSLHPHCLGDALERDFLFDVLWPEQGVPRRDAVSASEQADLWEGDIPCFAMRVGSRDIEDSRGTLISGVFEESALDRAHARLAGLDEDELERQVSCIRASIRSLRLHTLPPPRREPPPEAPPAEPRALIEAASRIGDRLARLAVHEAGEAHWAGLACLADRRFSFRPVETDLCDGTAGLALFFAQLARATGEERFEALARATWAGVRRELRQRELDGTIGALAGIPSRLYAALHLSRLWGQPEVLRELGGALRVVQRNVHEDRVFDVAGGAAGCIAVLLRVGREWPESTALAIADEAGAHLLQHARESEESLVWPPAEGDQPLLGFAHGAAGIAWALAQLAEAVGDERYATAAQRALTYERERFDATAGNWPDLRVYDAPAKAPRFAWSWCHGAPGIGIARLSSPGAVDDAISRAEVQAALASTLRTGFGASHCLCHGDLGNLDLLLWAAKVWKEPRWHEEALRHAGPALRTAEREAGWRCGTPGYTEVPGLMDGLAGIGYGLLRLADPGSVPSVLALEGPAGGP